MREPRVRILLLVLALIAAPAVVLSARCLPDGCGAPAPAAVRVPFCSLPAAFRELAVAGFRDGRSPDVMAATEATGAIWTAGDGKIRWPAAGDPAPEVPIAFLGPGIRSGPLPSGITLDRIAPTLEVLLGVHRPFASVRSGTAIEGVDGAGRSPLGVVIVWKGAGTDDLRASSSSWPWLRGVLDGGAAGTLEGSSGSLPVDPVATLTSIGTGGLPYQHGVTGAWVRTDDGRVVRAWGPEAPLPVIATFAEDLDHAAHEHARVGLIGTSASDRGLIGGDWYPGADDDLLITTSQPKGTVQRFLDEGFGADGQPDLLGVVLRGPVGSLDRTTHGIVDAIRARVPDATFAITATGSGTPMAGAVPADTVARQLEDSLHTPLVTAAAPGGLFLDEERVATSGIGADAVATALLERSAPGGGPALHRCLPRLRRRAREVLLMATRTETRLGRPPAAGRPSTGRLSAWWPVLTLLAVAIATQVAHPGTIAWLQNFFVVFGSLLVEAVPFVVLGAFVSAAIEVFVPTSVFARIGGLPRALQLPAAAAAGMAFPVCECGSVPVARRLARKGLSPAAAVTFMLAAPIVNPVVIASTYVAYRGRDVVWLMVFGRLTLGFVVAIIVGWVIGAKRSDEILKARAPAVDRHEDEPRAGRRVSSAT